MSQNFVETCAVQPQLFVISREFECTLEFSLQFAAFQDGLETLQQQQWLQFWQQKGAEIVLKQWNQKYQDYLATDEVGHETKPAIEQKSDETKADINSEEQNKSQPAASWDDLWLQHSQQVYYEQFDLFAAIFYNYHLDVKSSLAYNSEAEKDIKSNDSELENTFENLENDLEQLKLYGLPTSFGARPQANHKRRTRSTLLPLSCFFSDEEGESEEELSTYEEDCIENFNEMSNPSKNEHDILHKLQDLPIIKGKKKRKNKNRKLRNIPEFLRSDKTLLKYWRKRFSLFSRFDEGIKLDRESWFSVTPEKVAHHLAERLACDIIVDGFCGCGGNAIQFAKTCRKVIAIDIDAQKIAMAKHNAKIYGVEHKIEFIVCDFLHFCANSKLNCDVVFLSPPWGGPKYKQKQNYDIEKFLQPLGATELMQHARQLSSNVALFLPRNSNMQQIIRLAGEGNRCEIEHNYLDSRNVALTALYGNAILKHL